jgi:hypothetical protein
MAQERLAAAWARQTGGAVWALRYHNVYGPRDTPYAGVASLFRSALARGQVPRRLEDGRQRRDFVHVSDVARANLLALTAPHPTDGFAAVNVCPGSRIAEPGQVRRHHRERGGQWQYDRGGAVAAGGQQGAARRRQQHPPGGQHERGGRYARRARERSLRLPGQERTDRSATVQVGHLPGPARGQPARQAAPARLAPVRGSHRAISQLMSASLRWLV